MSVGRALAAAALVACAPREARDTLAEGRDVTRASDASADGYVYIARRRLGVVALAEALGVDDEDGKRITDRLADALEACVSEVAAGGTAPSGAARVVVGVDEGGVVGAPQLVLSPGPQTQSLALRCLVVPLRLLRLAPSKRERALALEATWGPS